MDTLSFKKALLNILHDINIFSEIDSDIDDDYINITCTDNTIFNIQIAESEFCKCMINNEVETDEEDFIVEEYLKTHTREDFLNNMNTTRQENPEYFEMLTVLIKIKEMGLISNSTMERIAEKLNNEML